MRLVCRAVVLVLLAGLVGCSSAHKSGESPQSQPSDEEEEYGGEMFCMSYEENYMTTCRQECEAGYEVWERDEIAACSPKCLKKLSTDETFTQKCPDEAENVRTRAAEAPAAEDTPAAEQGPSVE